MIGDMKKQALIMGAMFMSPVLMQVYTDCTVKVLLWTGSGRVTEAVARAAACRTCPNAMKIQ